jgi:hypothetical protein
MEAALGEGFILNAMHFFSPKRGMAVSSQRNHCRSHALSMAANPRSFLNALVLKGNFCEAH